jgi:putative nucleotidyltransferase with HDIG domain
MLELTGDWLQIVRIVEFVVLVGAIIYLSSKFGKTRYGVYFSVIISVIGSIIGYSLLSPFIDHTESIFFLATIAISARWGTKPGLTVSILSILALFFLMIYTGMNNLTISVLTNGGFLIISALMVGSITQKREKALKDQLAAQQQVQATYSATLMALTQALETRDFETHGHSDRVTALSLRIAERMGLDSKEVRNIQWGALLHDVGKIGVPDQILRKPGPLNDEEWIVMKKHPEIGFNMLKDIPFLKPALNIVHSHHERFDGKGYPLGLKGSYIPLAARIFSIVDSFDAMTSDRPYRKKMNQADAIIEIKRCSGSQFDPEIVNIFINTISA